MGTVAENIKKALSTLPAGVELVAVSKFQPIESIREAYDAGQRKFGESRVAELIMKTESMPSDVEWHFIGHIQTNKLKGLIGKVSLIESVDSERVLELIDRYSAERGVVTDVLMQVHVAREETKFGWPPAELIRFFKDRIYLKLASTRIRGLMAMATNTEDMARVEADFAEVEKIYYQIKNIASDLKDFDLISMGMSDDYPLAVKHGANIVRIGTKIFGER